MILLVVCFPPRSLLRSLRDFPFLLLCRTFARFLVSDLLFSLDLFVSGLRHVYSVVLVPPSSPPIAHSLSSGNVSLDPPDAASPRYDSAATLFPWHPLGCRGAKPHSATRVVIVVAALLREALPVAKLLLDASPAFDRSLARSPPSTAPRSSVCASRSRAIPWRT